MKLHMLIPAVVLALAACQTTEEALQEQGVQPLDSEAVIALVTDATLTLDANSGTWYGYFRPDGSAVGRIDTTGSNGSWKVNADGEYCSQWEIAEWRGGCFAVYQEGEAYRLIGRGARAGEDYRGTVAEGNTQNL